MRVLKDILDKIKLLQSRKPLFYLILFLILFVILLVYFALVSDFREMLDDIFTPVLGMFSFLSAKTLVLFNSNVEILNLQYFLPNNEIYPVPSIYLSKKLAISLLILSAVAATKINERIANIAIALTTIFLTSYFRILFVGLFANNFIFMNADNLAHGISNLFYLVSTYYFVNKVIVIYPKLKISKEFLRKIFVIGILFIVLNNVLYSLFLFEGWINIIFEISAYFIDLFKYPVEVSPFYLNGLNGNIYMEKPCLGFNTMLVFIALLFITEPITIKLALFSFLGLFLLNVANVIRFIMLFIHLQKNGDYMLTMDLHDIYNIAIYIVVFILWVIWYEKYSLTFKKKNIKV